MEWTFEDAKERFGELFELTLAEGPQRVQGPAGAIVVISASEHGRLARSPESFKDYLCKGPSFDGLDLTRNQ